MLSIIIPYYNKSQFFQSTIKSINDAFLRSNFDKEFVELIVVNDGSTSEESHYLKDILNSCIIEYIIINQSNLGVSSARNTGLRHSRYKFVYFLDADDTVCPGLFVFFKKKSISDCFNYVFPLAINNKVRFQPISNTDSVYFDDGHYLEMLNSTTLHLSSIIFSRALINNVFFNDCVKSGEDLLFIYNSLIHTECFFVSDFILLGIYKYDGKYHSVKNNGLFKVLTITQHEPLKKRLVEILNIKCYMDNCFFGAKFDVDADLIPLHIKLLCFFKSHQIYSLIQNLRFLTRV